LQTEIEINGRQIPCEVIESELESEYVSLDEIENPKQKWKLRLVTFRLNLPQNSLGKDGGKGLWMMSQHQYDRIKEKYSHPKQRNKDFIVHISYRYNGIRFECEFDDLSEPEIDVLCSINKLVEFYTQAKEVRIIRQGPIILRFHSPGEENSHPNWIRKFVIRGTRETSKASF
jgi:hypothetical protein